MERENCRVGCVQVHVHQDKHMFQAMWRLHGDYDSCKAAPSPKFSLQVNVLSGHLMGRQQKSGQQHRHNSLCLTRVWLVGL